MKRKAVKTALKSVGTVVALAGAFLVISSSNTKLGVVLFFVGAALVVSAAIFLPTEKPEKVRMG